MFLCVSPNPAIDKRITLPTLVAGGIHRARTVQSFPGGKSTHVAMVLKALGVEPHWVGMCGGAAGESLLGGLRALAIVAHPVAVKGETRTNLEIVDDAAGVTEIRETGEAVSPQEIAAFEGECKRLFEKGGKAAVVIFSGSLPPDAPDDLYARLIAMARSFHCRTLLDTSGEPLRLALSTKPDFVKPNRDEAAAVVNSVIDSTASAAKAAQKLMAAGARGAALSLGSDGMVFAASESEPVLFAPAVPVKPRSTVGCGDAALAGFAYTLSSSAAPADALRVAVACATANCVADSPGAVREMVVKEFEGQVRIETLGPP
ncbi:MAG TPA: 1-phosphofructokinase family hexose kinase [Candidatus Acidoferrum sp.]|nr:1-phosphofructokinase family hexose kinase [Candidatus Acidoferrum sp.]